MPLFTRRRLATMIDDIQDQTSVHKLNNLVSDLELPDTKKALAAEAELAIVWAVSQVGHCHAEPTLANNRQPDLLSNDLFPSAPAIVEIRAVSDYSFSGKEAMNRTANMIAGYADQIASKAGRHLYFTFHEQSGRDRNGNFYRRRCVDPKFSLANDLKKNIRDWILAEKWARLGNSLMLVQGLTYLRVEWRAFVHPHGRVFCSMPALAYDIEKNPVYLALSKKVGQIRQAEEGTLRCVLLFDAGCKLLQNVGRRPSINTHEIPAETIIQHALRKRSIDRVIVFSAKEQHSELLMARYYTRQLSWNVTVFDHEREVGQEELQNLCKVANTLPPPRFEGYQANSLHRQGSFNHDRNRWYLTTELVTNRMKQTIKFSSRMLQDYLAGDIDVDYLSRNLTPGDMNMFKRFSDQGLCITNARFIPAGPDEDDDQVEFDLEPDFSRMSLKKTIQTPDENC